jgi:hypothetical protein
LEAPEGRLGSACNEISAGFLRGQHRHGARRRQAISPAARVDPATFVGPHEAVDDMGVRSMTVRRFDRSISKAQIKELYDMPWLTEGRPVLLIGQTGVGKTFLAQAAGLHACACGKSVMYMTVTTWLENVALARSSGTYLCYRDKLAKPDVLILDSC